MINRKEIEEKSKEFEIHVSNVERDYVFGWLLFGIFTYSNIKDEIFLKGGNALRKAYFENTRFSNDLDFGIPNDINQEVLIGEINNVCKSISEKSGIQFVEEDNKIKEKFIATESPLPELKVYEVKIYFKDFYGNSDNIKLKISMDITRFDKVLLPIQTKQLIHPYSDKEDLVCDIRCIKLEEIIATKLKCLLQRQHVPDLFDYVHSVKILGETLDKKEVLTCLIKKTIFDRNPYMLKEILISTSFDYFKEYWSKGIICAKELLFNVEDAINSFLSELDSLFIEYKDNGFTQFIYFNPQLRVPIMKAGRTQTLLKVNYKGDERMIEPYSLKYLQSKNGNRREYFYCWNLTGGHSKPGIRCLVPENFSFIENTDIKFEPQFQIELSKAGEKPENPYLFDPNKPTLSRSKNIYKHKIKYIYNCAYCGKKFIKSKLENKLGTHKNKNGYNCGARYGVYIETVY